MVNEPSWKNQFTDSSLSKWQTDGGAMQSIRCRTILCIKSFRRKEHENARDLAHETKNLVEILKHLLKCG